jgi:hypothetical protein
VRLLLFSMVAIPYVRAAQRNSEFIRSVFFGGKKDPCLPEQGHGSF